MRAVSFFGIAPFIVTGGVAPWSAAGTGLRGTVGFAMTGGLGGSGGAPARGFEASGAGGFGTEPVLGTKGLGSDGGAPAGGAGGGSAPISREDSFLGAASPSAPSRPLCLMRTVSPFASPGWPGVERRTVSLLGGMESGGVAGSLGGFSSAIRRNFGFTVLCHRHSRCQLHCCRAARIAPCFFIPRCLFCLRLEATRGELLLARF